MRWGQVALLYLVAVGLAAEYWFVGVRPAAESPAAVARPRLVGMQGTVVREVRILQRGRRVVARRAGDGWEVVEPAGAPIPTGLIAAFANAMLAAEEIARVAEGADRDAFGLDDGGVRVDLVPAAGPAASVILGGFNPTGTALYAQRVGAPGVILIGRQARDYQDLIFQALPGGRVAPGDGAPVGG